MSQTQKRRNDVTTEIVVGAFMFTILVVLLTLTVVISQNKFWEKKVFLEALFPDVGGLKEGEGVFLRGVKIGNINRIEVDENEAGVRVRMRLTRDIRLYEDYSLVIQSSSMLGGMRLLIEEGSSSLPVVPEAEYMDLRGEPTPDLMGEATRTLESIRKSLVEEGTLDNIRDVSANLRDITAEVREGRGTIGRLIREDGLYEDARALVTDLKVSGGHLREVTTRLSEGKGMIGKLLSEDDSLYNDLATTLRELGTATADARRIIARLEKGEGSLGKLLSSDDTLYRDLADTLASLKAFSSDLARQQGTLGRLINEDSIYVKVEGLVDEARATLDDFRETAPLTTFTSIFFGAF